MEKIRNTIAVIFMVALLTIFIGLIVAVWNEEISKFWGKIIVTCFIVIVLAFIVYPKKDKDE